MDAGEQQVEALVALLRARPGGMTWPEIATKVVYEGDALKVWDEAVNGDALLSHPAHAEVLRQASRDLKSWTAAGLNFVTILDDEYPSRLLEIRETPPILFYSGYLYADDPGMSIVGSREASKQGIDLANFAARCLAGRGLTVISGLAKGIDAAAHRSALEADGRTVAFLGTGITRHFPPENRSLQEEISERGLVLSQFLPDAPPTKYSFPMRNASMSGYGLATIVIEAREHSGARVQARLALDHGRPVIVTKSVVDSTVWGKKMVGRPGVVVADGKDEVERAIDLVARRRTQLRSALDAFVTV